MTAVAAMDFSIATAVHCRLEALLGCEGYRQARRAGADLPEWVDEFAACTGGGFRAVVDALAMTPELKVRPPLAAVLPLSEAAAESRSGPCGTVQRATLSLGVYVVIAAPNDPGGIKARARGELSAALAGVRAALVGWVPCSPAGRGLAGRPEALAFEAGELAEIADGRIVWRDVYAARYWIAGGAVRPAAGAREDAK